jgi:ribosomal protein S14
MPKYSVKLCNCRSCQKTYFVDKEDVKLIKQCPFCGKPGGYYTLTEYIPIPRQMVPKDLRELFDK